MAWPNFNRVARGIIFPEIRGEFWAARPFLERMFADLARRGSGLFYATLERFRWPLVMGIREEKIVCVFAGKMSVTLDALPKL